MGWAHHVIDHYGIRSFLADIDYGREYWREDGGGIVNSILTWLAGEGFQDFMKQFDASWDSAIEFRQRHVINAIMKARKI
jgi:hypothetical protein